MKIVMGVTATLKMTYRSLSIFSPDLSPAGKVDSSTPRPIRFIAAMAE